MTTATAVRTTGTVSFPSFQSYFTSWRHLPGIGLTPTPAHLTNSISLGLVRGLIPPPGLLTSLSRILTPIRKSDPTKALTLFAETSVEAAAAKVALQLAIGGSPEPLHSPVAFHRFVKQDLTRAIPEDLLVQATQAERVPGLIREHLAALTALTSYPDQYAYVQQQCEAARERYYHALYSAPKTVDTAGLIHTFTSSYLTHLRLATPSLEGWLESLTPVSSLAIVGPAQSDATFCPRVVVARWLSQELPARWARKILPIGMIRYFLEKQQAGSVLAEVKKGCARLRKPMPAGTAATIAPEVVRTVVDPQAIWTALPAEHRASVPRPRLVLDDLSTSLSGDDASEETSVRTRPTVSVAADLASPAPTMPVPSSPVPLYVPSLTRTCFPFLESLMKQDETLSGLAQAMQTAGIRSLESLSLRDQALLLASVYPAHAASCRALVAELDAQTRTFGPEEFGTELGAMQETRQMSPFWMDLESGMHVVIAEDADSDGGEILERQSDGVGLNVIELDAQWDPEPQPSLDLTMDEQATLQSALASKGIADPRQLTVLELVDVIRDAVPSQAEALAAFRTEYAAWQARDRARSRALSLDLLQERLNAPGTLATKFGRHTSPWVQLLVTEALRTPQAPNPGVVLAGTLLPAGPVVDLDHPIVVATWITQMAQDRELFHELTVNPEAPESRAYLGLVPEAVLPSAELQKLASDLEVALVREAREALWASDEAALHPKLDAAVRRLAMDRGLDAAALLNVVSETIVPKWTQKNALYSALALAFITGTDGVVEGRRTWMTRIRRDGRRAWITRWIRPVAAIAYAVQRAGHWKARALQWGGLTPTEAEAYVRTLPDFEREFIRVRLHSAFGFMHERFGAQRITPTMPLGTAVRRSRQLAAKVHAAA